ncbi:unnamed protein product, partial [Nesidiocoris tenuis]
MSAASSRATGAESLLHFTESLAPLVGKNVKLNVGITRGRLDQIRRNRSRSNANLRSSGFKEQPHFRSFRSNRHSPARRVNSRALSASWPSSGSNSKTPDKGHQVESARALIIVFERKSLQISHPPTLHKSLTYLRTCPRSMEIRFNVNRPQRSHSALVHPSIPFLEPMKLPQFSTAVTSLGRYLLLFVQSSPIACSCVWQRSWNKSCCKIRVEPRICRAFSIDNILSLLRNTDVSNPDARYKYDSCVTMLKVATDRSFEESPVFEMKRFQDVEMNDARPSTPLLQVQLKLIHVLKHKLQLEQKLKLILIVKLKPKLILIPKLKINLKLNLILIIKLKLKMKLNLKPKFIIKLNLKLKLKLKLEVPLSRGATYFKPWDIYKTNPIFTAPISAPEVRRYFFPASTIYHFRREILREKMRGDSTVKWSERPAKGTDS